MKFINLAPVLAVSLTLCADATPVTSVESNVGSTIVLTGAVGADGSIYQWYKGGAELQDDVHIIGSHGAELSIKQAQPNDSGTYTLYVRDPGQTNAGQGDRFIVWVINDYQTYKVGDTFELTGPSLPNANYQWMRITNAAEPLEDAFPITNGFYPTLTVSSASTEDSGLYALKASFLTNGTNYVETEAVHSVTVLAEPEITDFSVTNDLCGDIRFVVNATGEQLNYRWFREGQPIPEETNSNLDLTCSAAPGNYSVIVSNAVGQVASDYLSLPFIPPPEITNFFVTNFCDKITFVVEAAGCSLSYQWYWESHLLAGETNSTLNVTCASALGNYSVAVSSPCRQIMSQPLPLPVIPPPRITDFVLVTAGDDVQFEVQATGCPLSYQWYWQDQPIQGATNSVLEYQNAFLTASAGYYSVVVSTPCGQASSPPPGLLFTKSVPSGNYEGIIWNAHGITVDTSGYFQMKVRGAKRRYSGVAFLNGSKSRFTGEFGEDHHSNAKLGGGMELSLQLVASNDTAAVTGTLNTGEGNLSVQGYQNFYDSMNPFPGAGRYTLSLLDTNLHALTRTRPDGAGYAILNVSPNGRVKLAGKLADGTPFSESRGLSQAAVFPLYVSLYKGQGAVLGWLQLASLNGTSIQGYSLYWIGYSAPSTFGNTMMLQAVGSPYTSLSPGDQALSFTEGVAAFTGGDLYSQSGNGWTNTWDFSRVHYSASTKQYKQPSFGFHGSGPENVSLKVNPGSGRISGSFIDPKTGEKSSIGGVLLQEQDMAQGYFLNENGSGYFSIESVEQ